MNKNAIIDKLEQTFGKEPTKENIDTFVKSFGYSCRMYWMQRTDKLNSCDYSLYHNATNTLCNIDCEHQLKSSFKPKYGDPVLFNSLYSHSQLEFTLNYQLLRILNEHYDKKNKLSSSYPLFKKIKNFLIG